MEQKKLTDEQMLEILEELADENGLTAEGYLSRLLSENQATEKTLQNLPEEVLKELENAKLLKREKRRSKKQSEQEEYIKKETEKFLSLFPDVKPDEIPESVWEEVTNGVSLPHAYALYSVIKRSENDYAEQINRDNTLRATPRFEDGKTEPSFTKEQVEAMSPREVSKNFKHILKSISKWKF